MGNNPKVLIGAGVIAVLGVVLIVTDVSAVGGAVLALVGIVGGFYLYRSGQTSDDDFFEAPEARPARSNRSSASSRPSTVVDDEPTEPLASRLSPRPDLGGGLPTWDGGGEPLTAWTPPEDTAIEEPSAFLEEEPEEDEDPLAAFEELDFGDEDELATLDAEFEELVDEEEELVTEVEDELEEPAPAPAKSGGFSFGNNSLIKEIEEVHSDADIMKSSAATELNISDDSSELAKLLAKVQSRLAAYE